MEPNDDDFQPSKPKSHSYPKTRKKLSSKHQMKLQNRKKCDLKDLYSPVSCYFKRNTSSFEADPLKTVPSKQNGAGSDNSDLINNKIPELRKQTETTSNEFTSDSEQILNPIMCIDSERTTGSHETLNYNINKSALDSSAVEGNPAPTNEDALQELRNKCVTVVEHGSCLMKASNDDTSDKSECVSMGEINETDNTLEYVGEVHSSYESGTKRHFSCPLCWKSFEKHELQMLHMKLCASQHNVTTRRLLDAVALQERQAAERKALGLPDIPTVCTVKKSSRKSDGSSSDSNLQLALALSASMQDAQEQQQLQQDDCLLEAGFGHEVVERQRIMLERFGFKRSCPAILAPSSSRYKPVSKNKNGNAVLMNRTKEERERLITEKVAIILMGEEGKPPYIPQDIQAADGIVDTNKDLQKYQDKSCSLWNMGSDSFSEKGFESYYVKKLRKFISPSKVPAGAKLKHLSQIPGRNKTPKRREHMMSTEGATYSPVSRRTPVQLKTNHKKETEAAEERRPKARQSFVDQLRDKNTNKNSFTEVFINDWKSLLNKKAMSDLTIYVEEDKEIPGHKLVLYIRCRLVLKDVVSEVSAEATKGASDMLLWVDVSYTAALAFLQFLYCGLTNKILQLNEEDMSDVKRLAQRYRLMELLQYLQVVSSVRAKVNKSTSSSLSSPEELTLEHNVTHRRKWNFLYPAPPSNQYTGSLTTPSPEKQMNSDDMFSSHDLSTELTGKSVCSVSHKMREASNEFHESAESGLYSNNARVSPDLFTENVEECVKALSQESRSSMDYLLSMIGKSSSQCNSQTNFMEMSSDKLTSATMSSVHPSASHVKNGSLPVAVIDDEVSVPNNTHISSSLQSHNKNTSPGKDMTCIECDDNDGDIQDKCDFLPFTLTPRNHMSTPETTSSTSSVKIEAQRNVSGLNYENFQQSSHPEEACNDCVPLQDSQEDTINVVSASDGIDFLEHLLSDSHSKQRDIKGTVESKRKHTEGDTISDHGNSVTKKVCRDSFEHEIVKMLSDTTELKESDKFRKFENDVIETFDLTQDSTDSELMEPQGFTLTPPIRENITGENVETEQNFSSTSKEYSKNTTCNDLFQKSEESSTTDEISKSEHLDNGRKTGTEESSTSAKQKEETVLVHRSMELANMQVCDDWDKFDEMCHASVPEIFSRCLSQLISTQPTSQKSLKSRTSPNKHRILQNNSYRSLRLLPSHPRLSVQGSPNLSSSGSRSSVRKVQNTSKNIKELPSHIQKSPKWKDIVENSLLAQLNESVFWRDENEPTLRSSPKHTVPTDHSFTGDHRTPTQKQTNVRFSDKVTPPADYSAMKTPQLKKELKKYGLKPSLSKKQAKRMLRYIYDQLHPYIIVSDSEECDTQMSETELSPFKKPGSDTQVPRSPVRKDTNLRISGSPVRRNIMRTGVMSHRHSPVTQRESTTSHSDTGSDSDDLLLSQGSFSSSDSALSVTEEVFCEELDVFSQGDIALSQDVCSSVNLATAVHTFITSDPDLHQKVLLYEPIWLEQLHAELKANNFKFKMSQLMDYLDEQCITFRTAQGQRNRQKKKMMRGTKRRNLTKQRNKSSDNKSPSSSAVNGTHSDS